MIRIIMKMEVQYISKMSIVVLIVLLNAIKIYSQIPVLSSMERVNENIHIDATEVNVGSWLSYYNWVLIHEGYINARKVLPDSSLIEAKVWKYINQKSGDYISTEARYTGQPIGYFKRMSKDRYVLDKGDGSGGFDIYNLPLVGVSYEQVVNFCKWRTKIKGKGKYIFRLPTESEWINYCKTNPESFDKSINMTDSVTSKGLCVTYNYRHRDCQNKEIISHIFQIGSFFCDKNNVFDMYGNVSEMVMEKGKAKGGNYTLYARQCNQDSVQFYTQPEKWLGFRCIAIKQGGDDVEKQLEQKSYEAKAIGVSDTLNNKYGVYTDNRDGKIYPTVKIGRNIWFSKNLAFKPHDGKYWIYTNKEETVDDQGYLYTWKVAINVCPDGWELPTKYDFEQLIDSYGDSAYVELRPNGSSGFCAFNCGTRMGVNFTPVQGYTSFWSSDMFKNKTVWGLGFDEYKSSVEVSYGYKKGSGLPVRCIKHQ